MTLNKRALLLIFPVVLAGYLLAGASVLIEQSRSVTSLEQARLSQQFDHLTALFHNHLSENRNSLYSMLSGSTIRLFVNEPSVEYRNNAIGYRMQENVKSLSPDPGRFVSFDIIGSDLQTDYYFENSDDPFAEMGQEQRELARRLFAGTQVSDWSYLIRENDDPLLVHSEFIDPDSFNQPLPSRKGEALLIQTAIKPDAFLAMKKRLSAEYGAVVEFSSRPFPSTEGVFAANARLGPDLFIRLEPRAGYLSERMFWQRVMIGAGSIAMGIASIGLIMFLLRRYITNPIARLDLQLKEVIDGARNKIETDDEGGEIGRLRRNMKQLHDETRHAFELVRAASWTDTLTGISNRAHFNILAARMIEASRAGGSNCRLMFIDIDNFKFVNDKYGHDVGDALLKILAERIRAIIDRLARDHDLEEPIFARLSGDEFAIMIDTKDRAGVAAKTSAEILALFDGGFSLGEQSFPVSASIGIAVYPEDATSVPELISNADAAMYQAKTQGKGRSARFSRSLHQKRNRLRLIQEALQFLDPDEEFSLVYMPIVNASGAIIACEALLRWTSPSLGVVTPDEFIPIAESSGFFSKIDHWVINKAMSHYSQLSGLFSKTLILSINISSAELHSHAIVDHVTTCAENHGLDPALIEIELTETYALQAGERSRQAIEALRAKGFRISIDDFGAGYTSVQQLIEYPADTIKLDRALVERLIATGALDTLEALISLCHAQNMSVIAEGVDTQPKLDMLMASGCDLFQGYLIGKPVPIAELGASGGVHATAPARPDGQANIAAPVFGAATAKTLRRR